MSSKKQSATESARKKGKCDSGPDEAVINRPRPSPRPGLPAKDSIISEETFKSPKGKVYRIIKTNEMDEYDEPVEPEDAPPKDQRSRKR